EDGIRDRNVTGVQTCALPICLFALRTQILVLSIRKQKYLCPECKKTATAKFKDTNYHDHFSNAVKAKLVRDLSLSRPMCEIAAEMGTASCRGRRGMSEVE